MDAMSESTQRLGGPLIQNERGERRPSLTAARPASDVAAKVGATSWAALQILCESMIALVGSAGHFRGAELHDMLPSLAEILGRISRGARRLRNEYDEWNVRTNRLRRLAHCHCHEHGEHLETRLALIERAAERVVEAIEGLDGTASPNLDVLKDEELSRSEGGVALRQQPFFCHLIYCKAISEINAAATHRETALPRLFPSMPLVFQHCTFLDVSRLKDELVASKSRHTELIALAGAHCTAASRELRSGLNQTYGSVASLLDALEILHGCALVLNDGVTPSFSATDAEPRPAPWDLSNWRSDDSVIDLSNLYHRIAVCCHRRRCFENAELFYTLALSSNARKPGAWRHRGKLWLDRQRPHEALADLTRALNLRPTDQQARRWRAEAYIALDQLQDAVDDYDYLIVKYRDDFAARLGRATALRLLGDWAEAWHELQEVQQLGRRSARFHLERGYHFQVRGKTEQAAAEFRSATALRPDFALAIDALAQLTTNTDLEPLAGFGETIAVARDSLRGPAAPPPARANNFVEGTAPTQPPETPRVTDGYRAQTGDATSPADSSIELVEHLLADVLTGNTDEAPSENRRAEQLYAVEPGQHGNDNDSEPAGSIPEQTSNGDAASAAASALADRETELNDLAQAAPEIPTKSQESPAHGGDCAIQLKCPFCNHTSAVRWDRLRNGKVFGCPNCQQHSAVDDHGQLVKLRVDSKGHWTKVAPRSPHRNRYVAGGIVSIAIVAISLATHVHVMRSQEIAGRPVVIPPDLETRAEEFGRAWLEGDYQVTRVLTLASQQGDLFNWLRKNPPASEAHGSEADVVILERGPRVAKVELGAGAPLSNESEPHRLVTNWWKEGEKWYFIPNESQLPAVKTAETGQVPLGPQRNSNSHESLDVRGRSSSSPARLRARRSVISAPDDALNRHHPRSGPP